MRRLILCAVVVLCGVGQAATTTHADVVAYYRFEEGASGSAASGSRSILDYSGNDLHGTPVGGPHVRNVHLPQSSRALDFDGFNDRIFIPDDPLFELTESLTLEAYIKLDTVRGSSQIMFRGDNRGGLDPWFLRVTSTGQLVFSVSNTLGEGSSVLSPEPIPVGEFIHVAGVLDDATGAKTLYINGMEVASKVDSARSAGSLIGPKPGIGIGNLQMSGDQTFEGVIDEVRISNAALDPSEFLPPVPETLFRSAIDGNWDAAATWNQAGLVPSEESGVVVADRVSIVADDADAASVTILQPDGKLSVASDRRLTAMHSVWLTEGTLDVAGTLATEYIESFDGTLRIGSTGALSLNGKLALWDGTEYQCEVGGESAGEVQAGEVVIADNSRLQFEIDGTNPFKAGIYTFMTADRITGHFGSSAGLGRYVSEGVNVDGLTYTDTTLSVTIDEDLNLGDANLSGKTDLSDFNIWNASKFMQDTDWRTGDFDGNGTTDLSDFNIWNAHKFTVASGGAAPAPTEVPEPGAIALLLAAAAFTLIHRQRRLN